MRGPMTSRLRTRLASAGFPVASVTALSRRGDSEIWRVDLVGGGRVKVRLFRRTWDADRVHRALASGAPGLPSVRARLGRALVTEFVDGVGLDRYLTRAPATRRRALVREAGRLLGALHGATAVRCRSASTPHRALLRRMAGRLKRLGLLTEGERERAWRLAAPPRVTCALTHGDAAPENFVVTASGHLRLIDEERLARRPVGFDLGRAVNRWPLSSVMEDELMRGYHQAGGRVDEFTGAPRVFWLAATLATSISFRLVHRRQDVPALAARLARLLRQQPTS